MYSIKSSSVFSILTLCILSSHPLYSASSHCVFYQVILCIQYPHTCILSSHPLYSAPSHCVFYQVILCIQHPHIVYSIIQSCVCVVYSSVLRYYFIFYHLLYTVSMKFCTFCIKVCITLQYMYYLLIVTVAWHRQTVWSIKVNLLITLTPLNSILILVISVYEAMVSDYSFVFDTPLFALHDKIRSSLSESASKSTCTPRHTHLSLTPGRSLWCLAFFLSMNTDIG